MSNFESSADVSIFLSLFFGVVVVVVVVRGVGGFTVIYFNVFLHESQPRITAGCFSFFSVFIPSRLISQKYL